MQNFQMRSMHTGPLSARIISIQHRRRCMDRLTTARTVTWGEAGSAVDVGGDNFDVPSAAGN